MIGTSALAATGKTCDVGNVGIDENVGDFGILGADGKVGDVAKLSTIARQSRSRAVEVGNVPAYRITYCSSCTYRIIPEMIYNAHAPFDM